MIIIIPANMFPGHVRALVEEFGKLYTSSMGSLKIMNEQNSRVFGKAFKKIQIAGFWKSFEISIECNSKNIILKNPIFL